MYKLVSLLTLLLLFLLDVSSFYVSNLAPLDYESSEAVEIKAMKMTSSKTQISYNYYDLPFCQPWIILREDEHIGEVLANDKIINTLYNVSMKIDQFCKVVCTYKLSVTEAKSLMQLIKDEYFVHLLADNFPVATKWLFSFNDGENVEMENGFRLGYHMDSKYFINNHVFLTLLYNKMDGKENAYRVVGFEAVTQSVDIASLHVRDTNQCSFNTSSNKRQLVTEETREITFSFEVAWKQSVVDWKYRWNKYLEPHERTIFLFSIINSLMVVLFTTGVFIKIILKLRRGMRSCDEDNQVLLGNDVLGWKLVQEDVFRPPRMIMLLVSFIGAGVQLFGMALVTVIVAMLGMLSPASRGALQSTMLLSFIIMGLFGGYFAGRLYKTLKGQLWKRAAFQTALLYPSICLLVAIVINFLLLRTYSFRAVTFDKVLVLLCVSTGLSLILVVFGFYLGFRKKAYKKQITPNLTPRLVPPQPWYRNHFFNVMCAGILPFSVIFIQIFYIFTALWKNQYYYVYGYLFISLIIFIICCVLNSIIMVYYLLKHQDHRWWWKSFSMSGSPAIYVFIYSIFFYLTKLSITDFIPTLLYFGYTFIIVFTFYILTGTIGFLSSFLFIKKIYRAASQDYETESLK